MYYHCRSLELLCAGCNHPATHTQERHAQDGQRADEKKTTDSQGSVIARRSAASLHQGGMYPSGWNAGGMTLPV